MIIANRHSTRVQETQVWSKYLPGILLSSTDLLILSHCPSIWNSHETPKGLLAVRQFCKFTRYWGTVRSAATAEDSVISGLIFFATTVAAFTDSAGGWYKVSGPMVWRGPGLGMLSRLYLWGHLVREKAGRRGICGHAHLSIAR